MAYEFNGTNQHISATLPSGISIEPMTLVARFYSDSVTVNQPIVGSYSSTNDRGYELAALGGSATDPIGADKYSNAGAYGRSEKTAFTTGTWYHGAGVWTSTTSRTVYLNGSAGTTNTTSVGATTVALLRVAANSNTDGTATSRFLDGRAAEVAGWSVSLTADEITSLHKGFKAHRIRPQSLVVYIPLVRNLQDLRAGLALTNNNTATVTAHPRVY